jgi:hypothetical protein
METTDIILFVLIGVITIGSAWQRRQQAALNADLLSRLEQVEERVGIRKR